MYIHKLSQLPDQKTLFLAWHSVVKKSLWNVASLNLLEAIGTMCGCFVCFCPHYHSSAMELSCLVVKVDSMSTLSWWIIYWTPFKIHNCNYRLCLFHYNHHSFLRTCPVCTHVSTHLHICTSMLIWTLSDIMHSQFSNPNYQNNLPLTLKGQLTIWSTCFWVIRLLAESLTKLLIPLWMLNIKLEPEIVRLT